MKKEGQISSDNLTVYRAVAMVMVVLYHCTCYYAHPYWPFGEGPYNAFLKAVTTLMGGIHMPVFVFISGYLFWMLKQKGHYKSIAEFYKKKFFRLIVPYLVVGVGLILMFDEIYAVKDMLYGICHLWFLLMLFFLFLLAPFFWKFFEKIKNDRVVTILIASSFLLFPVFSKVGILTIAKVFYFLPFFLMGYVIQRRGKRALYCDWVFWMGVLFFGVILFVFTPHLLFVEKVIREYASFVVIIVVSLIPNFSLPQKIKNVVTNFSNNSMGIYLFHHLFISYVIMVPSIKKWLDSTNSYFGVLLLFFTALVSSWILSILFNRFKFLRVLIGGK